MFFGVRNLSCSTIVGDRRVRFRIVFGLCMSTGCGTKSKEEPTTQPSLTKSNPESTMNEEDMYAPTYQKKQTLLAQYVITPFAGGKRLQAVVLRLKTGDTLIRSYRPVPEEYQYADKWVYVTGRPYTNSPYVQSVGGVHFDLESIQLHEDEIPYEVIPTSIPIPPKVYTLQDAQKREGLWVHCVGEFLDIQEKQATIKLADQNEISFILSRFYLQKPLTMEMLPSLKGEMVTVLGQWDGQKMATSRLCRGEVDNCGVETPKKINKRKPGKP